MTVDISEYVKGDLVLEAYVKTTHKIVKDLENDNAAQRIELAKIASMLREVNKIQEAQSVELAKLKAGIEEQNEVMLETGLMYEEDGNLYYS